MANMFASPPCSLPDKDCDIFGQSYADPCKDLFEQFLDLDSLDSDVSLVPAEASVTLLARPRSIAGSAGTVRDDHARHRRQSLCNPQDYKQTVSSPPVEAIRFDHCQNNTARIGISDKELLNLEGIRLHSPNPAPHTPSLQPLSTYPLTPATTGRRHRILEAPGLRSRKASSHLRRTSLHHTKSSQDQDTQRSPIRKITSPAKMLRTRQYSEQALRKWSQKLADEAKNFQFDFQSSPLSPPPSARVSDASAESTGLMSSAPQHNQQGFVWDHPLPQYTGNHHTEISPSDSTYAFQQSASRAPSNGLISPQILSQTTHSFHQAPWTNAHAPVNSHFSFSTPTDAYTDDADADDATNWWAHTSSAPMTQPSPALPITMDNFQQQQLRDKSQTLALQLQNELAFNANELALEHNTHGLMIQNLPPSPTGQSYVVMGDGHPFFSQPSSHDQNNPSMRLDSSPRHRYSSQPLGPINSSISNTISSPFGNLNIRKSRSRDAHSHSAPEDSPSPTSGTASSSSSFPQSDDMALAMSMSTQHHQQHRITSRRSGSVHHSNPHSIHPAANTNRSNSQHRSAPHFSRSRSAPRSHASQSGVSKSSSSMSSSRSNNGGGGGGGSIDFVNFTPSDSTKILTGVAPSGSSKTKARREKEAMEKQRRLSLAAVRAVKAVGGSIEGLLLEDEDAGFLG